MNSKLFVKAALVLGAGTTAYMLSTPFKDADLETLHGFATATVVSTPASGVSLAALGASYTHLTTIDTISGVEHHTILSVVTPGYADLARLLPPST